MLTEELRARLDQVLVPDTAIKRTPLVWLRQGAVSFSPAAIVGEIEKLSYVRSLGVERWDVSPLTPNRRKFLSQVGKKSTNQALQRTPPERRYPILVAFLRQIAEELVDESMDLFDRCMAQVDARSRRDLEEFRRNAARATNEKVAMFTDLTGMVLDPQIADPDLRTHIYKRHPKERLQAAMEESERLMRPLDDNYFDFLTGRYNYVRQFAPVFLSAFTFRANQRGEPLVEAVSVLNRIKRKVPENAPMDFVSAKWRPYVIDKDGKIDRHYYEMCVLWELRGEGTLRDLVREAKANEMAFRQRVRTVLSSSYSADCRGLGALVVRHQQSERSESRLPPKRVGRATSLRDCSGVGHSIGGSRMSPSVRHGDRPRCVWDGDSGRERVGYAGRSTR